MLSGIAAEVGNVYALRKKKCTLLVQVETSDEWCSSGVSVGIVAV